MVAPFISVEVAWVSLDVYRLLNASLMPVGLPIDDGRFIPADVMAGGDLVFSDSRWVGLRGSSS